FSYTNEDNKEVLWDIQFMSGTNGADYPSQLVIDAYWTGLGYANLYNNGYGTATYNVTKNLMASYRNSAGAAIDVRDTFNIKHSFAVAGSSVPDTTRPFIKKY